MDIVLQKTSPNKMRQIFDLRMEEIINAKEPFEVYYSSHDNQYYCCTALLLIPIDCYNELFFMWNTFEIDEKKIKKLLIGKILIKWDFKSNKYVYATVKDIIDCTIFKINIVYIDNDVNSIIN